MEKKNGKAKRGRPPKNPRPEVRQTAPEGSSEAVAVVEVEPQAKPQPSNFVFKSKYIKDRVTLVKPRKIKYDDGTMFIDPGKFAEFDRNTWSTQDPLLAQKLRDMIEERKDVNPLHIVETTTM
jgi:hypothetical protein